MFKKAFLFVPRCRYQREQWSTTHHFINVLFLVLDLGIRFTHKSNQWLHITHVAYERMLNIHRHICHSSRFQTMHGHILCRIIINSVTHTCNFWTRKPSGRWQTCATQEHAKNCSNSTCLQRCRGLAYLHSFSCCCVWNLRNPEKFTENSNLWSSRSSKVIDLGGNGKPICDFLLVINCNFIRICYRFQDIQA